MQGARAALLCDCRCQHGRNARARQRLTLGAVGHGKSAVALVGELGAHEPAVAAHVYDEVFGGEVGQPLACRVASDDLEDVGLPHRRRVQRLTLASARGGSRHIYIICARS